MHFSKKFVHLCFATGAWIIGAQGRCSKNPANTLDFMRQPYSELRIIISHRGLYGFGVVENSVQAVDAATVWDVDGIEFDVQIAKDGTLWPSHDSRIGRITNYKTDPAASYFDVFKDDPTGPKNPKLVEFTHDQLNALLLRDKRGTVVEGAQFHSLEYVLLYTNKNYPYLVILLDIKDELALRPAVHLVNKLGLQAVVVLKFPAPWLPPAGVDVDLKGVKFIPVTYVNMLDGFATQADGDDKFEKVNNYLKQYFFKKTCVSLVPPSKNWVKTPTGWTAAGPGGFVDNYWREYDWGIGKSHQSPGYSLGSLDDNGHCCVPLDRLLTNSPLFGKETVDQRTNGGLLLDVSNWVSTDSVIEMMALAGEKGYRASRDDLC